MQTLLIYQLAEAATSDKIAMIRIKDLLKANGYQNCVYGINSKGEKTRSLLPANMVCKDRSNAKNVRNELRTIAKACGVAIEWCFALEMLTWSGIFPEKEMLP